MRPKLLAGLLLASCMALGQAGSEPGAGRFVEGGSTISGIFYAIGPGSIITAVTIQN